MLRNFCYCSFFLLSILCGCNNSVPDDATRLPERELSEKFKEYWFTGEAEISSFKLQQSRYGEQRDGTAVLIFVTEDLLPEEQVKANSQSTGNIPVLKLNSTKNFVTGIYPYSIMQSVFYPLEGDSHALKVSASIQEWCGQVYMQLNNREGFDIISHSYFAEEADQDINLPETHLENEVWTQLRINPDLLPVGEINMIPSLEYIRLSHKEISPYKAVAEFYQDGKYGVYKISYPELRRTLHIFYETFFPFKIVKWEEKTSNEGKEYLTTATRMEDLKIDYWNKNSNNNLHLRKQLNLN